MRKIWGFKEFSEDNLSINGDAQVFSALFPLLHSKFFVLIFNLNFLKTCWNDVFLNTQRHHAELLQPIYYILEVLHIHWLIGIPLDLFFFFFLCCVCLSRLRRSYPFRRKGSVPLLRNYEIQLDSCEMECQIEALITGIIMFVQYSVNNIHS